MDAKDALRYVASQARRCRDRDSHEALCLLLPSICKVLDLEPMTSFEALDFWVNFRDELKEKLETVTPK